MSYLDAKSLCHIGETCSEWNLMSEWDIFWEYHCLRQFSIKPSEFNPPPKSSKILFEMSLKGFRNMQLRRAISQAPLQPIQASLLNGVMPQHLVY
mmetsp:Transcript_3708/g.4922  ORF Transcript_3708/g.4922 Transcript_3708/m.4922 type:complete len:95 (+) Transcript_3708:314-598(+)